MGFGLVSSMRSVGPVGGAVVAGLALALLHATGLVALSLCVLGHVVVYKLRGRLLMWGQDVKERCRGIARSSSRIQGSSATQSRGKAECSWGHRGESLFII